MNFLPTYFDTDANEETIKEILAKNSEYLLGKRCSASIDVIIISTDTRKEFKTWSCLPGNPETMQASQQGTQIETDCNNCSQAQNKIVEELNITPSNSRQWNRENPHISS